MSGGVCCRGHMKEKGEPCDLCAAEDTVDRENRIEELEATLRHILSLGVLNPAETARAQSALGDK